MVRMDVMLWILIIVSPIAFATKVFPKSNYIKKIFPSITYWDDWWEAFLQWVILGIPAALCIFLSNSLAAAVTSSTNAIIKSPPTGDPLGSLFGLIFSYLIPFIFLIQGFLICMSSGGAVGGKLSGYGRQAFGVASGYAVGRGQALASWTKGGAVGAVGAAAAGKDPRDAGA